MFRFRNSIDMIVTDFLFIINKVYANYIKNNQPYFLPELKVINTSA